MSGPALYSTADASWQGSWQDRRPICIGDCIRFIGRPDGEQALGIGKPPNTQWLRGGDIGSVTEIIPGYPPHSCPDHRNYPECICGDDSATVPGDEPAPVVAYESREGGTVPRCISPDEEGKTWSRE